MNECCSSIVFSLRSSFDVGGWYLVPFPIFSNFYPLHLLHHISQSTMEASAKVGMALPTKLSQLGHYEIICTLGTCSGNVVHVIFCMVL